MYISIERDIDRDIYRYRYIEREKDVYIYIRKCQCHGRSLERTENKLGCGEQTEMSLCSMKLAKKSES